MQIHLDMISQSAEGHAVILLDGAGWHSANSLIIPKNIGSSAFLMGIDSKGRKV